MLALSPGSLTMLLKNGLMLYLHAGDNFNVRIFESCIISKKLKSMVKCLMETKLLPTSR